jgi:hypothetical protein
MRGHGALTVVPLFLLATASDVRCALREQAAYLHSYRQKDARINSCFPDIYLQMPPLKSLKPRQISDPQLKIIPVRGKFSPKYPTIKTRDGSSVADEIAAQRAERDLNL